MSDPSDVVRTLEIEPLRGDEVMHSGDSRCWSQRRRITSGFREPERSIQRELRQKAVARERKESE